MGDTRRGAKKAGKVRVCGGAAAGRLNRERTHGSALREDIALPKVFSEMGSLIIPPAPL
jgi:hypothetical protein